MNDAEFITKCKQMVAGYFDDNSSCNGGIVASDVFVVWLSKTLQNNKALLSTQVNDGMYYEITYNSDKNEFYLDAYKKLDNQCYLN